jgi:outer membrane protein
MLPEPAKGEPPTVEAAPAPLPAPRRNLAFTAEPVVQPLPQSVAVTKATPAPIVPPTARPESAKKLAQPEAPAQASPPTASPKPVHVLAAKASPTVAPVSIEPVRVVKVAQPRKPRAETATLATTKLGSTAQAIVAAAVPAPPARRPTNEPVLAVAERPAVHPAPVAKMAPPMAQPLTKAVPVASKLAAATKPTVTAAPLPKARQPEPLPAVKLPVGEVVLAAYSPTPTQPATPPVKARSSLVETTAAKTVPIGAPAPVVYPEPAFGPPEAKFIPAALSSVEPPEQPATIGAASTLAQAIAYSYETNPRLLAERASTRAADLGFPAARAAFGPRLDASASLSYTRDRDEILPGSFLRQQGWSDTASLILSQPLLTFGRSQARVGQAAANIDFRRESLRLIQNEVMLDVIGAYVGTLREAGAVTIARENVALLQRQLEESNARFAVREITLADVQQVETRLSLGQTVLLEAQARLGEIHARFYRAVGMPPGELAPPTPLTLPITSLPEAYSLADNDSPLVRAAQARERISRAFLAGTRAEAAPRVDFRGSADYGAMSDYSRDLRGTRVRGTVTLSVPLFDSGARLAESGQAREANLADLQLIAAAQRDSRTAVATGWNNVLAARLSIDHYRQAVESAQRAYENAQRQERAGMRTTLDVLDLARDLLNVRNAYNAALADEYQARATLLATLGHLDPGKISDGIKLYDPADHFRKVKGKGDIPLLTGSLAALDGVVLPNLKTNKPSTDAAALVGTAETVTGE